MMQINIFPVSKIKNEGKKEKSVLLDIAFI